MGLNSFLRVTTNILNYIGCAALSAMMLLTVADVIMRAFGRPIIGTFEIVGLMLGLVIGFTIPKVSYDKGHVFMEVGLDRLHPGGRAAMKVFTRIIGVLLFGAIGVNLFRAAHEFRIAGEVSPTLQIPFYPVAYGVGVCCFIECLVLINEMGSIWRENHHEDHIEGESS